MLSAEGSATVAARTPVRGSLVLLAAAPIGRCQLMDVSGVSRRCAALSPAELTGTREATVIELIDPAIPYTVLDRIRGAAQSVGPLTLLIAGQLYLGGKGGEPYLGLSLATPRTLPQTAVAWRELAAVLASAAGSVTVLFDLVADARAWNSVAQTDLTMGPHVGVYGRVTPPPAHGRLMTPEYLSTCLALWGREGRREVAELHRLALVCAHDEGAHAVASAPTARPGEPGGAAEPTGDAAETVSNPFPSVLADIRAGRYARALASALDTRDRMVRSQPKPTPESVLWMEVCAEISHRMADPLHSCSRWMSVAEARIEAGEPLDAAEVEASVDRAHHQWQSLPSTMDVLRLGPRLLALRRRVPGRRPGAVADVERRIERCRTVRVVDVKPSGSPDSAVIQLSPLPGRH